MRAVSSTARPASRDPSVATRIRCGNSTPSGGRRATRTGTVARWTAADAVLPSAIPPALDPPWLATTSRSERDASSSRTRPWIVSRKDLGGGVDAGLAGERDGVLQSGVGALGADRCLTRCAGAAGLAHAHEDKGRIGSRQRDCLLDCHRAAVAAVDAADDAPEGRRYLLSPVGRCRKAAHVAEATPALVVRAPWRRRIWIVENH